MFLNNFVRSGFYSGCQIWYPTCVEISEASVAYKRLLRSMIESGSHRKNSYIFVNTIFLRISSAGATES